MTTGSQITPGSPDYFGLVDEVTSMVTAVVPPSKTVLMVSKGDENLLRLGSRTGWHFPRADDGRYAGHYPADSDDAVRQLELLRERGAGYLVFPATSLWWLDHYPELGRHLRNRYTCLVRDEDTCAIYDLTSAPAADEDAADDTAPVAAAARAPAQHSAQLTSFLDNLLPENANVAVVHTDHVDALYEEGVEFLVVPHGTLVTDELPYTCIARQRHLGSVYDLTQSPMVRREKPAGAQKTPWWRRWLRG